MSGRSRVAHFYVFVFGGIIALFACGIGIMTFFTHDRHALSQSYEALSQTYLRKADLPDISESSRVVFQALAREQKLRALRLNDRNAQSWAELADILWKENYKELSQKAMNVALSLDPDIKSLHKDDVGSDEWKPAFVLTHYDSSF